MNFSFVLSSQAKCDSISGMDYIERRIQGTSDQFATLGQRLRDSIEDSGDDFANSKRILSVPLEQRTSEAVEGSLVDVYNAANEGADYLWVYALVDAGIPAGIILKVWDLKAENFNALQEEHASDSDRQATLDSLAPSRTPRAPTS